ncbi:DedA family protein [Candidatus Legionella polyplacis]|uniref:VTT domain-containing protein n=1 Tax=Candidatus Legionella polyplacis TaxID=2005262 RepID=A0ABZ2GVR0_9GAMM
MKITPLLNHIIILKIWIYNHPIFLLITIFFTSLLESVTIIGNIIPGSVLITSIGFFIGLKKNIRIDLAILISSLGIMIGTEIDYIIGLYLNKHIINMYPFYKYTQWINNKKKYLIKNEIVSLFISKFIGPLRPNIPVILGILKMNHKLFFFVNIFSAIIWSIIFLIPGTLFNLINIK